MKVAIMTQPLGKNYGGIMQAWALQQVLKSTGHEPVTIDRRVDAKGPAYHVARFGYRTFQKILGRRKLPINFERHLPYILQHTHAFIDQHIKMSEAIDSSAKLKMHFEREQYDAVIVGSDQTWRPRYSPNIGNYFLDFLQGQDIKRIAYASSFGVDEWEFTDVQTQCFAPLVRQFDAISVRENTGVDLCKKHLGVEAVSVLDPTFLVKRESYESLYKSKCLPEKNGICTYILDKTEWKKKVVETTEKVFDQVHYSNQPKATPSQYSSKNLNDYVMPSVEGWIKGFADADFVITDSYHGTVFSIIFNKPFITLINPGRGVSRFTSLLGEIGLMDRLLTNYDQAEIARLAKQEIDYQQVNISLQELKRTSELFLQNQLGASIKT